MINIAKAAGRNRTPKDRYPNRQNTKQAMVKPNSVNLLGNELTPANHKTTTNARPLNTTGTNKGIKTHHPLASMMDADV